MSPAREVSALTFGVTAALGGGAFGGLVIFGPTAWMLASTLGLGLVAFALGALAGERVAAGGIAGAAGLGAGVLVATGLGALAALLAADAVARVRNGEPAALGPVADPYVVPLLVLFTLALAILGAVAGLVARGWARRASA